jgi:predicted permease
MFLALTTLILALAIGANTAVFSVAYDTLVRPLPYPGSERLVQLWPETPVNKMLAHRTAEEIGELDAVAPFLGGQFALGGGKPQLLSGARVGTAYFDVLGVTLLLGRTFLPQDGEPGAEPTLLLSHDLWRTRYAADEDVVGSTVLLNGQAHTVIGVLPPGHRALHPGWQVWLPLTLDPGDQEDYLSSFYLELIGRLAPGATPAAVDDSLRNLTLRLRQEHANLITDEKVDGAVAEALQERAAAGARPVLVLLILAVVLVLLIACANTANLMQAQALRRRHEIIIRASIGGSRWDIVRHLLVESLLLAMLAGAVALVFAYFTLTWLPMLLPDGSVVGVGIDFDASVLAWCAGISLVAAMLFGLLPARWASRLDLQAALQSADGSRSGPDQGGRWKGRLLVVGQVAAATLLLIGAGILLRSLQNLQAVDPGFGTEQRLALRLDLPQAIYAELPRMDEFYARITDRLGALPGVSSVGGIHLLPLSADNWNFPYLAEDHPMVAGDGPVTLPTADFRIVTPDFFQVAEVDLLSGRQPRARESEQVGWIDEALARELWGVDRAVGKSIELFGPGGPSFTVAGVVEGLRLHRLETAPQPTIYRPYEQWPVHTMYLVLDTPLPRSSLLPAVRQAVWGIDPEVPISEVRSVEAIIREATRDEREVGVVLLSFAALALVLALGGLAALIRFSVTRRTRELGIRMALGADRAQLFWKVTAEGVVLALVGLGLGLAGALLAGRWLRSQVFAVSPLDAATFGTVTLLVLLAAVSSAIIPAWRIRSLPPVDALRSSR